MQPTITPQAAAAREWDAIVIGAGVAGCVAAHQLARSGARVLLAEKQPFPRPKVCGGCLNARSVSALERAGLAHVLEQLNAPRIRELALLTPARNYTWPLPGGRVIERSSFDAALAQAAIAAGADFLAETTAKIGGLDTLRDVELACHGERHACRARMVLAADGLAGASAGVLGGVTVASHARIGAGLVLPAGAAALHDLPYGSIAMHCAPAGYAGLVRGAGNALIAAAAVEKSSVRRLGLSGAIAQILSAARAPQAAAALRAAAWLATPPLTRRAHHLAAPRVLLLGDAAGYVEPFTGEGMGWAIAAALIAAPLAIAAIRAGWQPALGREYTAKYQAAIRQRQRVCSAAAWALRHPAATRAALPILHALPLARNLLLRQLNAAWPLPRYKEE